MTDNLEHLPDIIRAAAASPLGIIALMTIALSALAYGLLRRSKDVWRFSALAMLFAGCLAFGGQVLRIDASPAGLGQKQLVEAARVWVENAERANASKALTAGGAPPLYLTASSSDFEGAWKSANSSEKAALGAELAHDALSEMKDFHRKLDGETTGRINSIYWADEAITYFREISHRRYLTEALLDRAAICLDLAQLAHTDRDAFLAAARQGDAYMSQAYETAEPEQRAKVLRISSRFYYDLARPKSFRLSDQWDNNYLVLAHDRALAAYSAAPNEIKNANQLARAVIRTSRNPPQNQDPRWTGRLRDAQKKLAEAWAQNDAKLSGATQRLSPLNVLGVVTLETVAREWSELPARQRDERADQYLDELETQAIAPLREALALLNTTQLRREYGFDMKFDIARAHALRAAILRSQSSARFDSALGEAKSNLLEAKDSGRTSQLEAAAADIEHDLVFRLLDAPSRASLRRALSIG